MSDILTDADHDLFDLDKGVSNDEVQETVQGPFSVTPRNHGDGDGMSKKSPRQSDEIQDEAPSKKKKTEYVSLFSDSMSKGPFYESNDEDHSQTRTSGDIGGRMSSLSLEHEDDNDNGQSSSRPLYIPDTVFESERPLSPALSELPDFEDLQLPADDSVASYGLRKNIDRYTVQPTFLDVDPSGDFDPAEEARKIHQKRKQEKGKGKQKAKGKGKGKEKARSNQTKERRPKLIVRLCFDNYGTVRNVTNDESNWPENHSELDSEDEREQQARRERFRAVTPGVVPQEPILDPRGAVPDLTGYPEARGCKFCRKTWQECSTIKTGQYPCNQCTKDGHSCCPIVETQPQVKGHCNNCIENQIEFCSFEKGKGLLFCDECFNEDLELSCVARPSIASTTNRIDLDRILYGPDRKHLHCTNCRSTKTRCSIKDRTQKPPCRKCKKEKIPCTFYDTKAPSGKESKISRRRAVDIEKIVPGVFYPNSSIFTEEDWKDLENDKNTTNRHRSLSPEIEMEDAEGRRGRLTKIHTSFAHPIIFHTNPAPNQGCSFCEMPPFGFTGLFEREVHVIAWNNGAGYTEFGGGHMEAGLGETIMCTPCVYSRLQILSCETHNIEAIHESDTDATTFDCAAQDLIDANPQSPEFYRQMRRWCSMCFSLAKFRCSVSQPNIRISDDKEKEEEETLEGCGLRLCDRCEGEFKGIFKSDLDSMAKAYDKEPKPKERDNEEKQSVRADVGFLRQDGLLMRSMELEAERMEE